MLQRMKKITKPIKALLAEGSDFHVEIDKSSGGLRLLASGVKRIAELSDKSLSLKCSSYTVKIKGERLSMSLYEDKSVEISGKLEVIEFENSKN